jgi:hypothetical protein
MKLIVSQLGALKGYVSREFYYVMSDLIADYNWKHIETMRLWHAPVSIERALLHEFGELPEVILFWEGYDLLSGRAHDFYRLDCRRVIMADDLHWSNLQMRQRKLVGFAMCERVLSTYAYVWDKFFPELAGIKSVVWIPHSASPDFMLDYNEQPANYVFLSGAVNHYYPLRQQMKEIHDKGSDHIAYHPHPGYHCHYDYGRAGDVGRHYAKKINNFRSAFTDSLRYCYVVAKYFEIPATGALLLADAAVSKPLRELGFVENRHYVPVSREDLEEKIEYVLNEKNHQELDEIRRAGQALVWDRHKTSDRARSIDEACRLRSARSN